MNVLSKSSSNRERHLLIAGTGRAGTSALVKYFTALGLETHVSKHKSTAAWYEPAQAGLEDLPVSTITRDLPYVVKSPWSYQLIDEILADPQIELDAIVIPVRDLVEAAASRTIVQLQAVHQEHDGMARLSTTWEHWASTPGGTIFSLHPLDQARLLAVGFHHLLERLVQADVPTVLLAFPRFATDPDYLFSKLSPVLPLHISTEKAREAHAATFSATKVRVGDELSNQTEVPFFHGQAHGPGFGALDNIALKRNLNLLRNQLAEAEASRKELEHERDILRDQVHQLSTRIAEAEGDRAALAHDRDSLVAQNEQLSIRVARAETDRIALDRHCETLLNQLDQATADMKLNIEAYEQRLAAARTETALARRRAMEAERRLVAIETSTTWRATFPLRVAGQRFPRLALLLRHTVRRT